MATKRRSQDRHPSGSRKMLPLPAYLHEALAAEARKQNRPITWELRLALRAHLRAAGHDLPPDDLVDD